MNHRNGGNYKDDARASKNRKLAKYADGGEVSSAKDRLAKGLRERSEYLNETSSIVDRDRREATMDAFSSGDYVNGTYKPFRPQRRGE